MKNDKDYLVFIKNIDLFREVEKVINVARKAAGNADKKLYDNVVDPFSAIFDSFCQGITLNEWLKQEKTRQIQKTLQNALGDFHQGILGSIAGWQNLGTGSVFDLCNKNKKIIAEIKNKHNTTKGNHKVAIYDDLKVQIKGDYEGYVAYYVEIIPKNRRKYNKPFTPSDNRKRKRRPANKNIRIIDGQSFYELVTGDNTALRKMYKILPAVIGKILKTPTRDFEQSSEFTGLFDRAY